MQVLKAKKLFETAVAVVRYFGGIKLGAGGLVRAYTGATQEALEKVEIIEKALGIEAKIEANCVILIFCSSLCLPYIIRKRG